MYIFMLYVCVYIHTKLRIHHIEYIQFGRAEMNLEKQKQKWNDGELALIDFIMYSKALEE